MLDQFEQYLDEFQNSVVLSEFLINLIAAALMCVALRFFYIRFGNSISNRTRFANIFLPLGLTTMLVITIVKSSIALSLGLVGALSIVRFRAAIKDPEELTYLFLAIGVGLAAGANQPIVGTVAFVAILSLILIVNRLVKPDQVKQQDRMFLSLQTDWDDLPALTQLLAQHFSYVELKRMDQQGEGQLHYAFVVKAASPQDIQQAKTALLAQSPASLFSLVDQPELVI
ncbi:MAG: DUF4956 domain-containing protein [Bacteroidota bacterium]